MYPSSFRLCVAAIRLLFVALAVTPVYYLLDRYPVSWLDHALPWPVLFSLLALIGLMVFCREPTVRWLWGHWPGRRRPDDALRALTNTLSCIHHDQLTALHGQYLSHLPPSDLESVRRAANRAPDFGLRLVGVLSEPPIRRVPLAGLAVDEISELVARMDLQSLQVSVEIPSTLDTSRQR